mgnify:CR=1 FL=1
MCGVIGVQIHDVKLQDIETVRNLFQQSQIRGKHATGVTYFDGEKLVTEKEPVPASEFMKHRDVSDWMFKDDITGKDSLCLIGHIRYSTSDLRFNQPFQGQSGDSQISIAHNGVLSQEAVESWEYETETANDSEMILRSFESGDHPLEKFADRSMAVTYIQTLTLADTNAPFAMLHGFRNHERPLYMSNTKSGLIFASTSDILVRSGVKDNVERTDPFVEYTRGGVSRRWHPMHLGTEEPKDLQP